ncbi:hypothetical protein DV737_g4709, partial [Chaetothyriales sp. CBS 132003]
MFGVILPSRPCLAPPSQFSPTQYGFSFPAQPHFSHVIVFLLPGNSLPDGSAAAIYLQLAGQADFTFLGAIANEKPSAIFKCSMPEGAGAGAGGNCTVGIEIAEQARVKGLLDELEARKQQQQGSGAAVGGGQLVKATASQVTTKVLAQRIIKHAFNFVSSFSGTLGQGGVEVVPLKAFEEWWRKFERKVDVDPSFLEKEQT